MTWTVAPNGVYAEPTELAAVLSDANDTDFLLNNESKIYRALFFASRLIDDYMGNTVEGDDIDQDSVPEVVSCPPQVTLACLVIAKRAAMSDQFVYGQVGYDSNGMPMLARTFIPEMSLLLSGLRGTWGIA